MNSETLSPEAMIEAGLFVGGPPLTAAKVLAGLRLPAELFEAAIDALNLRYRAQRRPYRIVRSADGYTLRIVPEYAVLKEKLFGGPRDARLSQAALDVLSLIAYQQPLAKAEIDAVRGLDSAGVLRQLVRLGLAEIVRKEDAEIRYGTTGRFLKLFDLASLDDLPRLGDTEVL
jgi:segregation and condensation protein B